MAARIERSRRHDLRSHVMMPAYLAAFVTIAVCIPSPVAGDVPDTAGALNIDAGVANAWQVLRTVDCARCHGKDYTGLAAPSIVGYAATQGRDTFLRMVLDGDPVRGMPGYRTNAYVAQSIDDIYRYFLARANGDIGPQYRPPATVERDLRTADETAPSFP